jgi:hypothetical protein
VGNTLTYDAPANLPDYSGTLDLDSSLVSTMRFCYAPSRSSSYIPYPLSSADHAPYDCSDETLRTRCKSALSTCHIPLPFSPHNYSHPLPHPTISLFPTSSLTVFSLSLSLAITLSLSLLPSLFLSLSCHHSFSLSLAITFSLSLLPSLFLSLSCHHSFSHTDPSDEMEVESLFFHSTPSKQNSRGSATYACSSCRAVR